MWQLPNFTRKYTLSGRKYCNSYSSVIENEGCSDTLARVPGGLAGKAGQGKLVMGSGGSSGEDGPN